MNDDGQGPGSYNTATARTLAQIGRRIREIRKLRGLTLQKLANASGISVSMLSVMERGQASPSIGSLIVVAESLGVTVSELMATDDHADDLIVRYADVDPMVTDEGVVRRVMKEDRAQGVSVAVNEYAPGTASNSTPIQHQGFEYGLVLEGELRVDVDGACYRLGRGDVISYASDRPHRIWNDGDSVARTIWFNTERR